MSIINLSLRPEYGQRSADKNIIFKVFYFWEVRIAKAFFFFGNKNFIYLRNQSELLDIGQEENLPAHKYFC